MKDTLMKDKKYSKMYDELIGKYSKLKSKFD